MSPTPQVSAPELASHLATAGMASILLSLFGAFWMVLALNAESWIWLVACVLIPASLLLVRGIGLMVSGREAQGGMMTAPEELAIRQAASRRILWLLLIDVGAIVVAANLLTSAGLSTWTVAVIAGIVGVQFLLWPRLLHDPFFYGTAVSEIVLCAVLAVLMHQNIANADALFGLIMGLTLWLTVIFLLLRGRRVVSIINEVAESASSR
ncbi:MAG: hypothetical protein ACRD1Y_11745 [Terriglobales bacterium]